MIHEIALCFAVLASGGVAGALIPLYLDLRETRRTLLAKVVEFDEITRKASEANNSMANKLLQVEEKVDFWSSQVSTSTTPTPGWKVR